MKLISCDVASFGTLKNFSYDFTEGLNTIKEDNGWGKSTLSAFVKAVFYGIKDSKHSVAENERIKFKPWNSTERFGGNVVFEWKGEEYRIERFFGNKAAEDTVRIFNAKTGKEFSDTKNLGNRIFGIDEEGFLSSVFLSQKDFEGKSNASITAKYNEVCELQNPEMFDDAVETLENKAKSYKMRGDKGLIADAKRELFALGERLNRAAIAGETAVKMRAEAEDLEKQTEALKSKDAELRKLLERAGRAEAVSVKKARIEKAERELEALRAEICKADEVLCGKEVGEEKIKELSECISGLNSSRNEKAKLSAELLYAEKQKKDEEEKVKKNGKPSLPVIISAIIAVVCAAACIAGIAASIIPLAVAGGAVAVVAGASAAFFGLSKNKKTPQVDESFTVDETEEKRKELAEFTEIEAEYEKKIAEFFSGFGIAAGADVFTAYSAIEKASADKKRAQLKAKELQSEISELKEDGAIFENIGAVPDSKAVEKELATVSEWYKNKTMLLAKTKAAATEYEKEADEIPDLESRKAELNDKIAEYENEYEIAVTALKFLKEADENLKVKYRKPLSESLNKYLSLIDGGDMKADIDVDLKVSVTGGGALRDTEYFSKGYKNLFEICKRFALTDVLFTAEKPFVVLDDPFCNLDDNKIKAATELLHKLGEEYQIIYFVCHESRMA